MTETGLFAGADFTLGLLIQQAVHALVPMILRPDWICSLPGFTDDKPSERCVRIYLGFYIKRAVFAQQFP